MALIASLGLRPTRRMSELAGAGAGPDVAALLPELTGASSSGPALKGGADVEVVTREFPAWKTKYGDLKVSATLKFQAEVKSGEGNGGFGGSVTSKDKPDGRTVGTKKNFSYGDIADRELFAGWSLNDFSIGFESEISGLDVTISGTLKFTLATNVFNAPAQAKLTLLNVKGAKEIAGPALEFKIAPVAFERSIAGVKTKVLVEYKAAFTVDVKKVGLEVGKKVLEKVAKEALEKEAKKQGVKVLGRKLAETVLKDLGPLAAAFGVGLDIGEFLNRYTAAPDAAKFVIDEILGDLAERYHEKDTLGKMWLISKNSPRILAALLAGGVIGTMAGVGDLVLFKLFGLDKLRDYAQALEAFGKGLTVMVQVARVPLQTLAGAILHRALEIGVKFNPKHAIVHHGALDPLVAGVWSRIRPLYQTRGGLDQLLAVRFKDCSPDAAKLLALSAFALRSQANSAGVAVNLSSPERLAESLRLLSLSDLLRFLEGNNLMRCNVSLDPNLDPDAIDTKLLDELYG